MKGITVNQHLVRQRYRICKAPSPTPTSLLMCELINLFSYPSKEVLGGCFTSLELLSFL